MRQRKWGIRLGLAALGAGMWLAGGPALAQPNGTMPGEGSGNALSRNLRTLADNPRSLPALMGAGQAALDLGDPRAALTFFARAEEVAPRDGRIKMWMGSALVQLEQPKAALKFFRDATDLGVAEADVARDRGLAYDTAGDPRRAQRDYRLALQGGPDAEVTRRLALSLAITGDRNTALQLLEPQLASGDRAAERTRALVLALTGDLAGAGRVVQASMPGGQGEAMMPFLARLPSLSYADRALAVHLGHFPSDGRTAAPSLYAANTASVPAYGGRGASAPPPTEAGRPDPAQQLLQRRIAGTQTPEPSTPAPARSAPASTARSAAKPRSERDLAPPVSAWSWSRGVEPVRLRAVARPEQRSAAVQSKPPVREPAATVRQPEPRPVEAGSPPPAEAQAPVVIAQMEANVLTPGRAASPPEPAERAPASAAAVDSRRSDRLADLAATVAGIDDPPPAPAASRRNAAAAKPTARHAQAAEVAETKPDSRRSRDTESADSKPGRSATAAAGKPPPASAKKPAPVREPSRVWVQVAGGADRAAFPHEFDRLKTKAPKLLGGRSAWAAKLNATNRLLVGPFADAESAQEFVNALRKADLTAFAWTSEAGEKVEKLPAK
jgi:Flp pilus assembly protein TadD